jgi:4-amino-4-deoxy-L-arabinose transferase-like glycosyltransferase
MVPMVEAPDEFAHFWVVKFIVEHARLPSHSDVFSGGPSAVYGPLPQMGYIPHVSLSKLLPFCELSITARLGSLCMGVVLICAVYLIARELYPKSRVATLSLPAIVIFHPQMALLHGYINSDSTAVAAAALVLWLVVRMVMNGLTLAGCSLLGLLTGVMALSKYASLAVALAAGFGVLAAGWLNGASLSLVVASCGIALSVFALTCNWWVARELHEYPGDFLGTQTMRRIWAVTYGKPLEYKISIWRVIKDFRWWRMTYFSYWGMFGYMTRYLYRPLYIIYFLYTLAAIAGGIRRVLFLKGLGSLISLKVRMKSIEDVSKEDLDKLKYVAIYSVFVIALLANLGAMIWSTSLNLGGAQGRYLFGCEVPIIALTVSGLMALSKRHGEKIVLSFLAFDFIVYVWSTVWLFHLYGKFLTKTY